MRFENYFVSNGRTVLLVCVALAPKTSLHHAWSVKIGKLWSVKIQGKVHSAIVFLSQGGWQTWPNGLQFEINSA